MAAEVAPARTALSTRSKSDTSVNDSDRRDSVKSDTSSSMGSRRAPRPPIDRTARRRSVAVMDLGTQARKPGQAFKATLGGSLLASRRGTAAFRSMFLPKLDAEPEEPKIPDMVPSRVKELLRKPSKDRTEEEAETIVRTMQKMPDFALFPFEIQKQLCQVAWYDSFGTGRVIIREGHAADGFYFVLSGRLVESYAAEDEANTVLRHGMKFGERELLTRTKRRSTVLTQERTELFCVHAQDYDRIFNLQEDRETANLNVCRPGFVIVPDSRRCDWIYVVKTGQCKVLKRLTPNEGWTVDRREENRLLHSREMRRTHQERKELFTAQGDRDKDNRALISVLWRNVSTPRAPISGVQSSRLDSRHGDREKGPSRMQLGSRIFDPDPAKPVFVVLDVLGPGQSFGFRSVLPSSERGATVSLVSNSAEVIQIKKKFFLKYADETVLSLIKMKYSQYPSQEDVLESLWKEHQWEDFKRDALHRAVSSVTSRQAAALQRPKTTKTN
ncbi:PREDICTED: cyclic nucleotide-binding domain-containing protein 2-like [Branchiostoma belcheri]|uniref:Cyclic nucleotide-binding domain-containing protein 2-like n=1 Tax=Branchiostoma belcheri TaxID=7741 RepID=A0A6P4ZAY5_BRABE|nr:PREDICTED: cyclic nucleotide-binding domain-containing protein 2-like [Branchiostoma belcheri]